LQLAMSAIYIRRMTEDDLSFADSLRALAGWNQTMADWQRFLACEPAGCFVAEWDGALAATATATSYRPQLGWIGMLLVHPDRRRHGIGEALLQHGIGYLESLGLDCIKLDATPLGQPVYERIGFKPECSLTRWELDRTSRSRVTESPPAPSPPQKEVERMVALDQLAFGANRDRLIRQVTHSCCAAIVYSSASGSAFGFGMLRKGARAYYIGPLVASTPQIANELAIQLLGQVPESPVFWDVLDDNTAATALVTTLGFKPQRPLLRMYKGRNAVSSNPQLQYALVDPAVG
jgi:GNAT superfamily N-acetyltransferase